MLQRRLLLVPLVAVVGAALAAPAQAQIYDLQADWSDSSNPNGVWSYDAGAAAIPTSQADWLSGTFTVAQPAWALAASGAGHIPAWMKLVGDFVPALDTAVGDVIVHANDPANGNDVDLANVTWTAPQDGVVDVGGALWMIRDIGRGVDWRLYHNDVVIDKGSLFDGDAFDRANPAPLAHQLKVAQKDVIRLELERTSKFGDFCGVDLTIAFCVDATWSNYGAGWPGTNGVPSLTPQSDPVLGQTLTVDLGNSLGKDTFALLALGLAPASLPTSKDGTLLLIPSLWLPLKLPAAGISLSGDVPFDPALCGFSVYLQALEIDAGASKKLSFTEGLELVLGD